MLRPLKNDTKFETKNVVCFYVGINTDISTPAELKKKKEEDWSYQDYMVAACDKRGYNLIWLNKDSVKYSYKNGVLNVDDDVTDVHVSLTEDNTHDTVIFQGQANDNMPANYEGLMRAFEYMGFFMFNTVDEIKIASDKYMSANLLSSKDIPQPNYVLVTRDIMQDVTTECHDTRESFWDLLDSINDNNPSIDKAGEEIKYVVKILGGSLGIGVFICNHEEIESILQTLFAIDPELPLIIQQFKENSGDIRVHVFSVDGVNYEVLAVMKRNKISKDFRSNVSLGATTQEYKLSKDQEEIVMNVAYLSGCRWVGVDLMECNDGSNVVIEYNSSPGVQGISRQIKKNMFDVVFDKIDAYMKKNAIYWTDKFEFGDDKGKCFTEYSPEVVKKLREEWSSLSEKRKALLEKCLTLQPGLYYKIHGKDKPDHGLDCSGYVKWVAEKSIGVKLPDMCAKYFRMNSDNDFEMVKKSDLKPGDIGVKNDTTILNHCGIYAGDGKWFDTSYLYGVQLSDYKEFKYFFRIKDIDKN